MFRTVPNYAIFCLAVALIAAPGCQTLHNAGVPGLDIYLKPDPEVIAREQAARDRYSLNHEHQALYWLLSHKIRNGMQLPEVEDALGETGEQTNEFNLIKSDLFQTTDVAYKWGPDNKGNSVVLFFREGRVVNFDQKDFVEAKTTSDQSEERPSPLE